MNVTVVMGGPSAEHEVSLKTGLEMVLNLDRQKYSVSCLVVDREKQFYFAKAGGRAPDETDLVNPQDSPLFSGPFSPCDSSEIWKSCDMALLALHGAFGEDGTFQGYLETVCIPYSGSGVLSSAVSMDKILSKQIFMENGIDTPVFEIVNTNASKEDIISAAHKTGYPCFIKCPQSGSSRLMGRAENREELLDLVSELGPHCKRLLVERCVSGPEYSCAVISTTEGGLRALPPVLIKPAKSAFFDFEAKYTDNACEEIVPAPCSKELTEKIRETALSAHRDLGCSVLSRTDMIESGNRLYVLELNSLPGMTKTSLIPKAFEADGGTYSRLLDNIIQSSLQKTG